MFSRIYTGMFVSLLLAAVLSYGLYYFSWQERRADYEHKALQGTIQLVSDELHRLPVEKRVPYLDIVAQLLGADIRSVDRQQWLVATNREGWQPESGETLNLSAGRERIVWMLVLDDDQLVEVSIKALSEQQFRAYALLLVSELSRKNNPATLEQLQVDTSMPLAMAAINDVSLDAQQLSRLRRGGVVVDYGAADNANSFSVFARLDQQRALVVGPVPQFSALSPGTVIGMLLVSSLVIIAVAYWLVSQLEKRLRRISRMVRKFGRGDLQARVALEGNDSIAELGQRVDAMATRIEHLLQSQREIMQAVSHELRTPLARIRFRLGLLDDEIEGQQVIVRTTAIRRDLGELEQLIDEVLEHHKLTGLPDLPVEDVDVGSVVNRVVERIQVLYPAIVVSYKSDETVRLPGHVPSMERLLANLVGNACKFAEQQVVIRTTREAAYYCLMVDDDGPGVEPGEREKVFEPFYQVDGSRNKQKAGYGLGLAIVKRIADLHQATIRVSESPMGGARFIVCFPEQVGESTDLESKVS